MKVMIVKRTTLYVVAGVVSCRDVDDDDDADVVCHCHHRGWRWVSLRHYRLHDPEEGDDSQDESHLLSSRMVRSLVAGMKFEMT